MIGDYTDETIELELYIHHQTKEAILVSEDDETEAGIWLPLSQVEVEHKRNGTAVVTMPEWLAAKKGLV